MAVALFLLHYLIQAAGWSAILRGLGQTAPAGRCMRMWYMSLVARWMPGPFWYSASRLLQAREAGLDVTAVAYAIILELMYIIMGSLIATVLFAGALLRGIAASAQGQTFLVTGTLLLIVSASVVLRPATLLWMCRFPLFRKAVKRLTGEGLADTNMPSMTTRYSLGLLTYYTMFWIFSGVMFGVLANAFVPMRVGQWIACIPAFAGSWLIGFLSIITPAGLGAREGALWLLLKPVMPHGSVLVLALTSRLTMVAAELLSVGLATILLRGAGKPATGAVPKVEPVPAPHIERAA